MATQTQPKLRRGTVTLRIHPQGVEITGPAWLVEDGETLAIHRSYNATDKRIDDDPQASWSLTYTPSGALVCRGSRRADLTALAAELLPILRGAGEKPSLDVLREAAGVVEAHMNQRGFTWR